MPTRDYLWYINPNLTYIVSQHKEIEPITLSKFEIDIIYVE